MRSPVLLIIYNRADAAALVFEAVRAAKPPRLYIAADGPRANRPDDPERCAAAKRAVEIVDWECEVHTLYQEQNLGPLRAQVAALDWFFAKEEEGVVLEDDCLPHPAFFGFCDALLERYRNDRRVFMISGNNFQEGRARGAGDYYFSAYVHIWGWAAWRRSWQCFDARLAGWPAFRRAGGIDELHGSRAARRHWTSTFDNIYKQKGKYTWDYSFQFACWRERALAVLPQVNLVSNIGFGADGSYCLDPNSPLSRIPTAPIHNPPRAPDGVMREVEADEFTSEVVFGFRPLLSRVARHALHPVASARKLKLGLEHLARNWDGSWPFR